MVASGLEITFKFKTNIYLMKLVVFGVLEILFTLMDAGITNDLNQDQDVCVRKDWCTDLIYRAEKNDRKLQNKTVLESQVLFKMS